MRAVCAVALGLMMVMNAVAFEQDPRARPGPQPGVKNESTEEELAAQQNVVVAPPVGGGSEYTHNRPSEATPDSTVGAKTLTHASDPDEAAGPGSTQNGVDGAQVLRETERDLRASGPMRLLKPTLGLILFAAVGFGVVAFARNWAEKNAPNPATFRQRKPTKRVKKIR